MIGTAIEGREVNMRSGIVLLVLGAMTIQVGASHESH